MRTRDAGLVLILVCALLAHAGCASRETARREPLPTTFLWEEPLAGCLHELEAAFGKAYAEQMSAPRVQAQYRKVQRLAEAFAGDGVLRSYRVQLVPLGSKSGSGVLWYIETNRDRVFLHDCTTDANRLVARGIPTVVVVFLDEDTARGFEQRIAEAKLESLRSARGFSTAHIYTLVSAQEGNSAWSAQVLNLTSDERARDVLLEQGGDIEKRFIRETEAAAVIDRALFWLLEELRSGNNQ